MTPTLPSRRPKATLAAALCLAAATLLLVLCSQATARAHGATCPSSSVHRVTRGASPCGRSGRRSRVRAHARAKRHHAKHKIRKAKRSKRRTAKPPAVTGRVGAVCEDGTAPILAADGSLSCQDGSEPTCEDGAGAVPSGDGSALVCDTALARSLPAATCEDGTAPVLTGEAFFSCRDGSEPRCEAGGGAVPSSDGSVLVCQLADAEERTG